MRLFLKISGITVGVIICLAVAAWFIFLKPRPAAVTDQERQRLMLMPLPADISFGKGSFHPGSTLNIETEGPADQILEKSLAAFSEKLRMLTGLNTASGKNGLKVEYSDPTRWPQPGRVDESYKIIINGDGISLSAQSAYGVMRGLESILQLSEIEAGAVIWPELKITDAPRFPWRGLMIDAGRHFIPKEVIIRNLDAMSALKMNVFHWHLSEYQGFRVESKLFPLLHEKGSKGEYYTQDEIKEVVEFAAARGIRIVPEFDLPGHSSGFLVGYPWLGSAEGPYKLETGFGIFEPVIDPTREEVYDFLDRFFGEMATLFPDSVFHIGGDEVDYSHWEKNPSIQAFMIEKNLKSSHDLQAYFNSRLAAILNKHGKRLMGWDEILNTALPETTVIQSWRSQKSLFETARQGKKGVLSWGYYLDHKLPAGKHYSIDPLVISGAVSIKPDTVNWKKYSLTLVISGNEMHSELVIYGPPDSLRGYFSMMDNPAPFETATITGTAFNTVFHTDYGAIKCAADFSGDSVSGKLSLGLLSFDFTGKKSGGNDMAGTTAPEIQQIIPLTEAEKTNILGGEAAMWTEVASHENIEFKIWPRLAAMAEKWWTPASLTTNTRDMYRRLESVSGYLDQRGLMHKKNQEMMLKRLSGNENYDCVRTLFDALQEVTLTERLDFDSSVNIPLVGAADAASPESNTAAEFGFLTDDFLASPSSGILYDELVGQLVKWRDNHQLFAEVAKGNLYLAKIKETSDELSRMAGSVLKAVEAIYSKLPLKTEEKTEIIKHINSTSDNREHVYIAVKPAFLKLAEAAPTN
jgi:hexosaminidase